MNNALYLKVSVLVKAEPSPTGGGGGGTGEGVILYMADSFRQCGQK